MKFLHCKELGPKFSGYYTNFKNKKQKNTNAKFCDIRQYIKINQKRWLDCLEEWHSQLCKIGTEITPYWWLVDGSRFYTWSPPIYSPFIFSVAIYLYCKDNGIKQITLIDCPNEVFNYLKEIDGSSEIIYLENYNSKRLNTVSYWIRILRNTFNIFLHLLNSFRYLFVFNHKTFYERKIIFSQIFDSIEEKNRIDHFFGKIFENIEDKNNNLILWLYQYNLNFRSKKNYKNKILLKKKNYKIVQELNKPLDILNILIIYIKLINSYRIIRKKLPLVNIDGIQSKILPEEYFSFLVNGVLPLNELLLYNSFKKIIKFNKNIDTVIYPYEEKTLERALLISVNETPGHITTIAYSHSVHWNLHYWYHIRNNLSGNSPRPDIYSVTGILEKWWLNSIAKVPKEKIKILGSNRYAEKKYPVPKCNFNSENMKILIVVGQSCDMNILANYIEDESDLFDQCNLIIRKYPFSWEEEQNIGILRIKNLVKNLKISNEEPLDYQIEWSDIIIYNTSSCGIIGMLRGRIAVNVALHDIFYWDSMEKEGSKNTIIHCSSASELKEIILQLKNLDKKKYKVIQDRQFYFANNIYSSLNNQVLDELLKNRNLQIS